MTAPNLCPACGARNDCSMASAETKDQPCWCYSVSIDPQILQALPLEQRNSACLCPRCADVLNPLPPAPTEQLT
ncbi:cysteine-rich CWC family protein [Pseudomonas sp. CCC3.1]|uniref:cysteine-rich CWC family protein n=1 Tax=Pseudomonas sp. CCC3.1 TaxID=3048607 RepID=UPI002AC9D0F5|nr:cysteine-rich CWC family protein [Pseudomonas sp. CCC3.1]MEB0206210.1 cysteine-rich CWC family protein [Pseudomonas sp. CCC3.1]WPX34970.1 cysteine-rich CWC family protein [Pseudomonas sp. CCC3.1]